jgi:hypothetical protein
LERAVLATWEGVTIRYTGWRLDQADLDVWLTALHIAREYNLGMRIPVTVHGILKAMGRCTGKHDHEWFKSAVARLTACAVEITIGRKTYGGSLIEGFERDEITGDYVLFLNPKLAVLFEDNAFTWIDWEQRRGLSRDLAKWLHSYILSHQATPDNPHRIGLARLRELCGSDIGRLRDFRVKVREAMAELKAAGVVVTWRITPGDALEVIRSQRKQQLIES